MTNISNWFPGMTRAEQKMARLIEAGIAQARAEHRPIDTDTARRIAACLHHGLGGELACFAGTGRITHLQTARLEVFYAIYGEPRLAAWGRALSTYLRHPPRPGGRRVTHPSYLQVTAPTESGGSTEEDPAGSPVAYLRTFSSDVVSRPGLALQMQYQACRIFTRQKLHRRLSGVFADRPGSHGTGLARLMAHLVICHGHQVIVPRLDRLPPGSPASKQINTLGARVLSASEHHTRRLDSQRKFNQDINPDTTTSPSDEKKARP